MSVSSCATRRRKAGSSINGLPFARISCAASLANLTRSFDLPSRAMPVRSCPRRYFATSQPRFSSPTSMSTGTLTSSKNTSFRWWLPSIETIGRTVMPGVVISISRNEMPSWRFFAAESVRTRQKHQSAWCAVEVQIRPRLGETLAPPVVDIGGARQKAALLLFGAELDQHRADHRDVERGDLGRRRQLVFLKKDHALHRRPAGAAIFVGPIEGRPAAFVEDTLPAHGVLLARRIAEPHPLADVLRQMIADEGAQLVAELDLVGGKAQIQGPSPLSPITIQSGEPFRQTGFAAGGRFRRKALGVVPQYGR